MPRFANHSSSIVSPGLCTYLSPSISEFTKLMKRRHISVNFLFIGCGLEHRGWSSWFNSSLHLFSQMGRQEQPAALRKMNDGVTSSMLQSNLEDNSGPLVFSWFTPASLISWNQTERRDFIFVSRDPLKPHTGLLDSTCRTGWDSVRSGKAIPEKTQIDSGVRSDIFSKIYCFSWIYFSQVYFSWVYSLPDMLSTWNEAGASHTTHRMIRNQFLAYQERWWLPPSH